MKHLSIASVIVVLIVFSVTFIVTAVDSIGTGFSDIRISLLMSSIAALVACLIVVFWAVPVHLVLNRLNQLSVAWYILAAIIPSFVIVYVFKPFGFDSNIDLLKQALFCSFVGSSGALAFWYIAVYRQRISRTREKGSRAH